MTGQIKKTTRMKTQEGTLGSQGRETSSDSPLGFTLFRRDLFPLPFEAQRTTQRERRLCVRR